MFAALALFLVPTLLYVVAFLYETYLSFRRLNQPKAGRSGYVTATWEVTHTLLVFAIVMLLMMFTQSIDRLGSVIFVSGFTALIALTVRAVLYLHIFYSRTKPTVNILDWMFAWSHVVAAAALVVTVLQAVRFIVTNKPLANTQFLPYFLPGLLLVLLVCGLPLAYLYLQDSST